MRFMIPTYSISDIHGCFFTGILTAYDVNKDIFITN